MGRLIDLAQPIVRLYGSAYSIYEYVINNNNTKRGMSLIRLCRFGNIDQTRTWASAVHLIINDMKGSMIPLILFVLDLSFQIVKLDLASLFNWPQQTILKII